MIITTPSIFLITAVHLPQPRHHHCIIILPTQLVFVRSIHLVLSQLTEIVYCVIYDSGGQVVLTSGMSRLLGITILEFRTFTYHRLDYTFLNFLLYVLRL